ncbi:MAG: hypothetical protein HY812_15665 [Planctomycetes bacterium]|nr:hypothetical protein [Planctomycetota bacterium]
MLRRPRASAGLSLLGAVLCAPGAAAGQQGEPLCGDCQGTGRLKHEHAAAELALEEGAIFCSVFLESDPEALGLDWVPCAKCRTPSLKAAAESEFAAALAPRRAWLEERRKTVDEAVMKKVDHVETAHFVIAFDIPKIAFGKRVLSRHEGMHLYARRMEELHRQILDLHGMTDADTNGVKHHLYLFESQKTAQLAAPRFANRPLSAGTKVSLLGIESHLVSWDDPSVITCDEERHQFLTHAVSHHVHDAVAGRQHWLFQRYGWVYEGLAHYMEVKNFGSPVTWCTAEAGEFAHWQSRNWEANVKRAVAAGEEPAFQDILGKDVGSLSAMDHQFAWSYIDYLLWLDPKKMLPMLQLMTGPQPADRDCLQQAYGLTVGQFVEGWREYVREEYTLKPWQGPMTRSRKGKG